MSSVAVEDCKARFLRNTTFFHSYNLMMTIANEPKIYKQNITVSVGLFLCVNIKTSNI